MSLFATLLRDLVQACRRWRRSPSFVLLAAGVLALGIAATTAIFALVRGVVLRPLPYPDAERLVVMVEDGTASNARNWPTSVGRLAEYNGRGRAFVDGLAASRTLDSVLVGSGEAERVSGARVTGNFFAVLGVQPALGRWLGANDVAVGAPPVVVISDGLWRRRFGADPKLVGRTLNFGGTSHTVLGIAPRSFAWPRSTTEFWVPFVPTAAERNRAWYALRTFGRLAPGVGAEAATAELTAVATALDREYPDTDLGNRPRLVPMLDDVLGSTRSALRLLEIAALLVLLVATGNFANLLLARGAAREGEFAVRLALGGGPISLVRLQLVEGLALAGLGGGLGLLLGDVALRLAVTAAGEALPRAGEVRIDGGVIAFTVLVALTAGALGAVLPAFAAGQRPAAEALRNGSRSSAGWRRRRWLAALVVLEVAAATSLAASSGLLLRGLQRLMAIEPGVDPRGVVTLEVGLPPNAPAAIEEAARYYRRLIDASRDTHGLTGLSAISRLPVVGAPASTGFELEGQPNPPGQAPVADLRYVEPGAWSILSVPLLAGRPVEATDLWETPRVVWINQRLARAHFGDGDPIGRRLWIGNERGAWRTIVGVVGDVHLAEVERPVEPTLWLPFSQATFPGALRTVFLVAKSPLAPAEALASLAGAVRRFDALQAPSRPRSLSDALAGSFAQRRLQAALVQTFALVAGGLAMIGIYAMTTYSVASRRDELGVRLALGANALLLGRLVLTEALRLTAAGLLLGLAAALAILRPGTAGLAPWDPSVLLAVILAVLLATVCATLAPALRAARTSPARALREG